MEMELVQKEQKKIPAGAEIISKTERIQVEEIQNGFILRKTKDIQYKAMGSDHTDYMYIEKKWYSKENPMSIKMGDDEDQEEDLADKFE